MKTANQKGLNFLEVMDQPEVSKAQIFNALFTACGSGDEVNTNHVFFQDVIVKFNAQKARGMILKNPEFATPSHYVDVALGRYMSAGWSIKDFSDDLREEKLKYNGFMGSQSAKKKALSCKF